jgi:hypothetical protein
MNTQSPEPPKEKFKQEVGRETDRAKEGTLGNDRIQDVELPSAGNRTGSLNPCADAENGHIGGIMPGDDLRGILSGCQIRKWLVHLRGISYRVD